ncbi:unnamed protein product [Pseudo-nitzschia multistriata]|uniref:Uncharacterized protein n=1 Tax=Pseudo-nitzschia multistriata TaxID=183589 RepID=A0A448ZQP2_9STRA|nr:unnamed protein product [Pseudo-nitzschia multistriata]
MYGPMPSETIWQIASVVHGTRLLLSGKNASVVEGGLGFSNANCGTFGDAAGSEVVGPTAAPAPTTAPSANIVQAAIGTPVIAGSFSSSSSSYSLTSSSGIAANSRSSSFSVAVVTVGLSKGPSGRAPLQLYSGSSFSDRNFDGLSADQSYKGFSSDTGVS